MFAAKMRLPSVISVAHRHAIVNRVLRELNLRKIADSRIGGWRHRGISGGERKRVSIGMELVANPSLLFLDEPTTGLSATDALQIMAVVRRIAQEGMTVVCSIHQPRSQLYSMFDRLLLLSNGAPVYFGPAQEAVPFFESCGLTCPPGFNVADFLLDNITITSTHPSPPAVAGQGGTANVSFGLSMVGMEPNPDNLLGGHDLPASDAESIGGKSEAEEFEDEGFDLDKWQVPEEQVRMLLMKWEGSEQCRHVEATARNAHSRALKTVTTVDDSGFQRRDSVGSTLQQLPFLTEECPRRGMQKRRVAASCWKQFAALVGRNCVSLKREPWIPVALVVQCCIFGVIVGSLWSSLTRSVAEGQLKALFFLPTFLAISTFLSASRYIKEQQMFMR
ncbi:ABCG2 [Symbiodinium sp. KB8]|nr:ABCG2 [Symbiodinium sp. KB8]